jgi:hypothetical protein
MGAARWEALNRKEITDMGKNLKVALAPANLAEVKNPNVTFPSGTPNTSSFLPAYEPYYYQFQANNQWYFWALAPYALVFSWPSTAQSQEPYTFTITETKREQTPGPNGQPQWGAWSPPADIYKAGSVPQDPKAANVGTDGGTLSWGTWTPPGGGPTEKVVVLTDTPSIARPWADSVAEEAELTVKITDKAGASQTFKYHFTLTRNAGQSPTFSGKFVP